MFVLSFKNNNKDPTGSSFDKHYMPLVEIKDFNAIIDNKTFLEQPQEAYEKTRSIWKAYEKLIEMSRKDDYTTGTLLSFLYHQNYY